MARVYEISILIQHVKEQIVTLDLSEPSFIEPNTKISQISAFGEGIVEAPRGALIHRVGLKDGKNSIISDDHTNTVESWKRH
jgi:uptake hydrogenase large subunit